MPTPTAADGPSTRLGVIDSPTIEAHVQKVVTFVELTRPARDEVDQRGHARVALAFLHLVVVLAQLEDIERGERLLQERRGVELLGLRRAAGTVSNLLGAIALQQEQPSRLERPA